MLRSAALRYVLRSSETLLLRSAALRYVLRRNVLLPYAIF